MICRKHPIATVAAALVCLAAARSAEAVPFTSSHNFGDNWNSLFAQGFKASIAADPDPGLAAADFVYLDGFEFFKSGDPDITESFRLAILNNYFVDLDTLTTSSPELVGLSTNSIAGTASIAVGDPIRFEFDSLELVYGDGEDTSDDNYAAAFVTVDEEGVLNPLLVPVIIANYIEEPPGSGTFVPETDYGDVLVNYFLSASNFINGTAGSGRFFATFNDYFADARFIAYFNLEADDIPGDFSGNGAVENADLTLLLNNWGAAVPPAPAGWIGSPPTAPAVDNDELTALLNNWGNTVGNGTLVEFGTAVPEPGACLLAAFAALGLVGARGRITRSG